jgi:Holliday junction DNA helicase RuvA
MIGVLTGSVLFSDGTEAVFQTSSGVGYQTFCSYIFPEGELASVYVSHIIRESSESLFAFRSLREKKLFELLTTVKGVGPKSAYNVVSQISIDDVITAVSMEQKGILTKVSGVGAKAASQMILDLKKKIHKIKMYSSDPLFIMPNQVFERSDLPAFEKKEESTGASSIPEKISLGAGADQILNDTILACENLGFQTEKVVPLAQKILKENVIKKPEQLVHLVLKEI